MNIFSYFHKSSIKYGDNTALVIARVKYSYSQIFRKSMKISSTLKGFEHQQVGIFTTRSLAGYTGILGTLASGKTYVPLNIKSPILRNCDIIHAADIQIFIVDKTGLDQIKEMSSLINPESIIICPEIKKTEIPLLLIESFEIYCDNDLQDLEYIHDTKPDENAYIMFTSGSTGTPKGVPISHYNVSSYIEYISQYYKFNPDDKFSQTFDLTFDLSVHDLFISWSVGAELYIIPDEVLIAPTKFLRDNKLTVWFSVPSLAQMMNRFRMLKENSFPNIRYSFFCGEPLPKTTATAWQRAAPDAILVNIYGPTETTIGISHYKIPRDPHNILEHNGIVSIGNIFSNHEYCLINEKEEIVQNQGELCLSGAQVSSGYWNKKDNKLNQFFKFQGEDKLWYKTGDVILVESQKLNYITRKDFQVKIRGYRIELEEINNVIRNFTRCNLIYSVPYPIVSGVADGIYSFVDNSHRKTPKEILIYLKDRLPAYMIPRDILVLKEFPMHTNGKINIKKLIAHIEK